MDDSGTTNLNTALLAAQRAMGPLVKNAQNPHLRNKYADISAVLNTIEQPLWDNGLIVVQRFVQDGGECPILATDLIHVASNERITSAMRVACKDPSDPQKIGAAITYYRRYSLMTLLGLSAEDDDGNAASKPATPLPHPLLQEIRDTARSEKERLQSVHDYYMGAATTTDLNKRAESVRGLGLPDARMAKAYNWHAERIEPSRQEAAAPAAPPSH